ncbi:MAG: L,D-transpeptidase [Ignavibacteriae bacterium]|nr:L,D-transpeptidase [Ignavibacteriota bacterium]
MLLFVKHFLFRAIVSAAIILTIVSGCNRPDNSAEERAQFVRDSLHKIDSVRKFKIDSTRAAKIKEGNERFPVVHYSRFVLDKQLLDSIRKVYAKAPETMDGYRAFTTVNRKDIQFYHIKDTVVIPDSIFKDLRAYSIFPQYYPAGDTIPKIVFVSPKYQCYACYDSGRLVRFAACNSGEERKPSFPGRYGVNWKSRLRHSSLDSSWVLPFTVNFHLQAGSAFHQFEMPGRPVSHSCVRQFLADAEWLFKWVRGAKIDKEKHQFIPFTGTPVIILDVFDFSRRWGGPWRELTTNKDITIPLPDKPMEVEEALIPMSQIPLDSRGSLINRKRYITAEDTLRARGIIREGVDLPTEDKD